MKRKGFIFMEVLLALLLLSALAAAVFPTLGQTMGAAVFMERRTEQRWIFLPGKRGKYFRAVK